MIRRLLDGLISPLMTSDGRRLFAFALAVSLLPVVIAVVVCSTVFIDLALDNRRYSSQLTLRAYAAHASDLLQLLDGALRTDVSASRSDRQVRPRRSEPAPSLPSLAKTPLARHVTLLLPGRLDESATGALERLSGEQIAAMDDGGTALSFNRDAIHVFRKLPGAGLVALRVPGEALAAALSSTQVSPFTTSQPHCRVDVPPVIRCSFPDAGAGMSTLDSLASWPTALLASTAVAVSRSEMTAAVPLPRSFSGHGPLLALSMPALTASDPKLQSIYIVLLCSAIVAAFGLAMSWLVAFRLTRPIRSLSAAADRLHPAAMNNSGSEALAHGSPAAPSFGGSIREMYANFVSHLRVTRGLATIDREVLAKADISSICRVALSCAQDVMPTRRLLLAMVDPLDPTRLLVCDGLAPDHSVAVSFDLPIRYGADLPDTPQYDGIPDLPDPLRAYLDRHSQARRHAYIPVMHGSSVSGCLIAASDETIEIERNSWHLLAALLDRIAVAISAESVGRSARIVATTDRLTGLPTRERAVDLLNRRISQTPTDALMVALCIELPRFKDVNDSLGSTAGDSVLIEAARRLRSCMAVDDLVARCGGGEFALVLGGGRSRADAVRYAAQINECLAAPFDVGGKPIFVGSSVGVAIFPDDAADGHELLKKASVALHWSKRHRSRYSFYDSLMSDAATARIELDTQLRAAIERREFFLLYQPKANPATNEIVGVEALIRWRHPDRGVLAPSHFIDALEESGLIGVVGEWVLRTALLQMRSWTASGIDIPRVAVNVSNRQLNSPKFFALAAAISQETGVPMTRLEIEVTESMFIEGGRLAIDQLEDLERAGALVAIDDFGAGYSSFSHLRTLPASIIKLDRSFISELASNRDTRTIVAAMISMSHALGKSVVAEGVETREQLAELQGLGCDAFQGYLFSLPIDGDSVANLFRDRNGKVRQQQ